MTVQGTASAAATSVAIPAHAADDLIIVVTRAASNTAPTKPTASGTVPNWTIAQAAGANTLALSTAWFVATTSTTTTGAWTGASHICVLVLRPATNKKKLAVGVSAVGSGNNVQTIVYPALTFGTLSGTSWGVRCGTRGVAVAAVGTAPTGWTSQIIQPAGASALMSVHTRSGITSNPVADTVTTSGTNAAYRAHTLEVTEQDKPEQQMVTIA